MTQVLRSKLVAAVTSLPRWLESIRSQLRSHAAAFPVRAVVLLWLFWTVFVHLLPAVTTNYFPTAPAGQRSNVWPYFLEAIQTSLTRWDSHWFHEVVERGYYYYGPTKQSDVRFYPLYPSLICCVKALTPLNTFQAGTLVSALATLGSLFLVGKAAQERSGDGAIFPTFEAILLFPCAFLLATVYSESTTLFLFLLATRLVKSQSFIAAGFVAFAAGLSRVSGCLILLPLLVTAVAALQRKHHVKPYVMLGLGVLGTIAYPGYLWWRFGDLLLFFHVNNDAAAGTWIPFYSFLKDVFLAAISALVDHKVPLSVDSTGMNLFPINFGALCLMFWTLRASILRKRWDDAAFMVGACFVAASSGNLQSLPRLAMLCYPLTLHLGERSAATPYVRFCIGMVFLSLQTILLMLFVHWTFVF